MIEPEYEFDTAKVSAEHAYRSVKMSLGKIAQTHLESKISQGDYLQRLIDNNLLADAMRWIAFTLPARHSVWWGSLCLGEKYRATPPSSTQVQALAATTHWVIEPNETTRQAAEHASNRLANTDAFRMLARAAAHREFKLPRPTVMQSQNFRARAVVGALELSMVPTDAEQQEDDAEIKTRHLCLRLGLEVSRGKRPWPRTTR